MAAQDSSRSLFDELKRRNVYRVGLAYVIVSWLVMQVLDVVVPIIAAPDWVQQIVLLILAIGFPIAVLFAWAYELTPEGLKLQRDVDRDQSITGQTGRRLDAIIIGIAVILIGFLIADRVFSPGPEPTAPAAAPAVVDASIAVLPFANMSSDESSGHFSDGLADTLLHMLAQISDLRVAARTSSFQFRDSNSDIGEIARKLNVSSVLEGSVQKAGDQIRVTAQLIDADTGYHLWSGTYDRSFKDIFAIQDEIAGHVVDALKVSLLGEEEQRLQHHATDSVEAYTQYLLGIQATGEFSFESLPRAVEHLQRATELDPDYALAHVALANAYLEMFDTGIIGEDEMLELGVAATERALAIDPNLPGALALQAVHKYIVADYDAVEPLLLRAVELAPNDVFVLETYGTYLVRENRPEEAQSVIQNAIKRDPLSIDLLRTLSRVYDTLEQFDDSLAAAARIREINPQAPSGYYNAGFTEFRRENWAKALMWFLRAMEVDPADPELAVQVGDFYLDFLLYDDADRWYQKAYAVDPEQPMARSSLLVKPLHENDMPAAMNLAREILTTGIDNRNSSRDFAMIVFAQHGDQTGDYSEFLSWAERFEPQLFTVPATGVLDNTMLSARIAHALQQSGKVEQGRALAQQAWEAQQEITEQYRLFISALYVAAAADEHEAAQQILRELAETPLRITGWDLAFDPPIFVKPYFDDPIFIEMRAEHREHAMRQREILLELNGGSYP